MEDNIRSLNVFVSYSRFCSIKKSSICTRLSDFERRHASSLSKADSLKT